jgi:MoCo/4Fe-4S cofactor protein with predicted Tat translocation signal
MNAEPMNDQSVEKPTLDLTKIKALMDSGGGPRFWRSLDELAETDEFRRYLEDELPIGRNQPSGGRSSR